ncbi:HAD family acid phosphatase, partial [Klebsiella pneumoniae]
YADNDHLILKTDKSSKESRRQKLAEKYNIVLFFGDNLSDFSDMYYYNNEGKTSSEKVLEHPELFGSKFIILPNAMYGDWESSMYKKNTDKKL